MKNLRNAKLCCKRLKKSLVYALFCISAFFIASCASENADKKKSLNRAGDPNDPFASQNIDPNQTLSERKIIEILRRQKMFFDRIDSGANISAHDAVTEKRRIGSLWDEYLVNNPKDVNALILYGKFCRTVGDTARSYAAFAQANLLDENIAVVKQQMAVYEAENEMPEEALKHMNEAIKLQPERAIYYVQRAQMIMIFRETMVASEKFEQAHLDELMIKSYAKAVEIEPRNTDLRREYALAFFELGKADWNEALKQWKAVRDASALDPEKQSANLNVARVLIELHRDDEAEKILNQLDDDALLTQKLLLIGEIQRARAEAKRIELNKLGKKE